eukprot:351876-Chlamydomonas_euryale.AAC.6
MTQFHESRVLTYALAGEYQDDDIVLDFKVFDCCITILEEVTTCLKSIPQASSSSATYVLYLVLTNALSSLPCDRVKNELMSILNKHGWNQARQQFNSVVNNMEAFVADIDALADRLLAN